MSALLFGTAGIPLSTQPQTTIDGIRRVAELGLDCMELEFVQGVYLDEAAACEVAQASQSYGIKLSAHAPYYLNFNAHETRKLKASRGYLLKAARIASLCNAHSVVFHAGFYLGDPAESAYQTIYKHLAEVVDKLKEEDIRLLIRPEVSGKPSQFGSLDEILRLCAELEGTAPCIDFAHWHARTGENNSYDEFASALESVRQKLGDAALQSMHLHISGIEYSARGERRHLEFEQSDLKYIELLKALKDYNVGGTVICESPIREEDAIRLKDTYSSLPDSP
ncbi:TIM barrel protein [Chloroflexota bacterium]